MASAVARIRQGGLRMKDAESLARDLLAQGQGDRTIARQTEQTRDWVRRLKLKIAGERSGLPVIVDDNPFAALPEAALSPSEYVERITACWRKSVDSILMVGRLLAHAKKNVEPGQFLQEVVEK